jgi:hypothetical protein
MNFRTKTLSLLIAAIAAAAPAHAEDERAALEKLRQTTLNLIEALVETGALTRDKANALVKKAEQDSAKTVAQRKPDTTVRVPYIPEVVKNEIREQIKKEVLTQASQERWGEPNAYPSWLKGIKWEGDLRLRFQSDRFDKGNATPLDHALESSSGQVALYGVNGAGGEFYGTRAAELANVNSIGEPTANTMENRNRFRVRARLGILASVSDEWSGGVRLATGSATDRVSTNQTLGQDWNKYTFLVDRAYLSYAPTPWLSMTGGRIANPWFSTDLVWDEDLNFEGMAATFKSAVADATFKPYLTVGAFPIKEENPPASTGRWMYGIQGGAQWKLSMNTSLKFGLAWYDFKEFEGQVESTASLDVAGGTYRPVAASYGQYEYGSNLRQKGNTLFRTNALGDTGTTSYWGLASRFRPVNLTASLDLAQFDPVHAIMTADWVKNTAFDRNEIATRTQGRLNLTDGKDYGYQYKLAVGMPQVKNRGDWQASAAYRYLGSDAVVDAFTDSDFGLGGTNLKGYILNFQYGVDRNATVGLRWYSADSIDSFTLNPDHRFSVDVFQAEVNVRF